MDTFPTRYSRIRVTDLQTEIKMVGELRKIGQPFKVISMTDYIVSAKQRKVLDKKKIHYEVVTNPTR